MSHQNEPGPDDPPSEIQRRIEELEAELHVAKNAAAMAEAEQGRLQGELTKTTELWVAACHAREEWDALFAENIEALRLANEQLESARSARVEMEQSTSWRVIQALLAPYRVIRGRR